MWKSFDPTVSNVASMKLMLRLTLIVIPLVFIISVYAASIMEWHIIGIAMLVMIMTMGVVCYLVIEYAFNQHLDKIQIYSEGVKPFNSILGRIRGIRFIDRTSIDSVELRYGSSQGNENVRGFEGINTTIMIRKRDGSNILVGRRSKEMATEIARKINGYWAIPVIENNAFESP